MEARLDILNLEDEAVLAMVYMKQLRKLGCQALGVAFNGEDALAAVEKTRPKLMLLDIKPSGGLDGIDVAEIIRRRNEVPSVFSTAISDADTLRRAWMYPEPKRRWQRTEQDGGGTHESGVKIFLKFLRKIK